MTHTLWRIATDTPDFEADDLSGKGAELTAGRWNARGLPAVYASETRALACLETVVHLNAGGLPLNRYLVALEIPDPIWTGATLAAPSDLPVGWDAEPAGKASLDWGSAWLRSATAPLLLLPSAIVPEERNALINPRHPHAGAITATKVRRWLYDPRLMRR